MAPVTAWTIKRFDIQGMAAFFGVIGLVWGVLAGVILLAGYVQGYLAQGDVSLIQSGLFGLTMMIVYGIFGGFVGGAIVAFVFNRLIGVRYGFRVELDGKK